MESMLKQRYSKKGRHIRWNWERSPESDRLVRYHFIVVDDRNRSGIMNKILEQFQKVSSGIEQIGKNQEGKVKGTEFRYLFSTFDTALCPNVIDFTKIGKPVKRDGDLIEGTRRSIEDYVSRVYEM